MKTYVQLGRYGDIMNMLPLLYTDWRKSDRKEKSAMMVAKEFAPILEGVSYVEPVVFDGSYWELGNAIDQCKREGRDWVCTQVNGPKEAVLEFVYKPAKQTNALTTSFQKEMWRVCDRLGEWDQRAPLVFDRRSPEREAELVQKLQPKHNPYILLSTSGSSSPFPYPYLLKLLLNLKFKKQYDIIDISYIVADRIYDLLQLYEGAYCLVATDSAPLHLARACPELPVCAITNDQPILWNGSSWQPQHIWYCRYSDFPFRCHEMLDSITVLPEKMAQDHTKVIHIWSEYHKPGHDIAKCAWYPLPIKRGICGRDTANTLKDPQRHPYLRDVIRMGIQAARDGDFICITRPDTQFPKHFEQTLFPFEAAYAYRITVNKHGAGEHSPIVDMFFARKSYWQDILPEVPDLVFGNDYFWPHVLWALFREHKATDVSGCVWRDVL